MQSTPLRCGSIDSAWCEHSVELLLQSLNPHPRALGFEGHEAPPHRVWSPGVRPDWHYRSVALATLSPTIDGIGEKRGISPGQAVEVGRRGEFCSVTLGVSGRY